MKKTAPIGLFDSGIGGTSIWQEVHTLLPQENSIYLADSAHAPYGERSKEEIINLSKKNTELLIDLGCKCVIVACNTATTNAISTLRATYEIPFIGIEPAIKPAAKSSRVNRIGVLATQGTLSSSLFHTTALDHTSGVEMIEVAGIGLVQLIESGKLYSPEMTRLLTNYSTRFKEAEVDQVVLGCSHYPYLIPQLQELLPDNIRIVDSGEAVARQVKNVLTQSDLLNTELQTPELQFYSNGEIEVLRNILTGVTDPLKVDFLEF
ncbi:glutamate racemase [Aureitalea marina]|uniref:Glutamate racemase n=1 Tax=Aureitalea marina TaxID=930804 RepID=A0A2S7KRD6_9FLAO|nr:glutamate racemase [Aureitalea marina]PQB05123.1 glutamate racemase [Aureitalea marina]